MLSDEMLHGLNPGDLGAQEPEDPKQQLQAYLKTLPLNQRKAYLASMRGEPRPTPIAPRMPTMNDHGHTQAFDAHNYASMMHNMQGAYLGGMAQQANQAISDEMQSRVAQEREARRMAHEQQMERIRQETEQMKINALIQRLGQSNTAGYANPAEGLYLR